MSCCSRARNQTRTRVQMHVSDSQSVMITEHPQAVQKSQQELFKEKVLKYHKQLDKGCGKINCESVFCHSCPGMAIDSQCIYSFLRNEEICLFTKRTWSDGYEACYASEQVLFLSC
jgi:hypothetical protein